MEAASGAVGVRRSQLLSENRAMSVNLRDLLRIKQGDNNNNHGSNMNDCENSNRNLVGLTLGAVLGGGTRSMYMPVQSNRTLLDIIRDDPFGKNGKESKKSWNLLKQMLKIGRAGSGSSWASSVSVRHSDVTVIENTDRDTARRNSTRLISDLVDPNRRTDLEAPPSSSLTTLTSTSLSVIMRSSSAATLNWSGVEDRGSAGDNGREAEEGRGEPPEGGGAGGQPIRMSLMSLLEDTNLQLGLDGLGYTMDDNEEEEEEDESMNMDVDKDVVVKREVPFNGDERPDEHNSCCVCMVRHKGAAFIPCGHTFCRLCSRELWVQRGNCPLCNHLILEILDIF